MTCSMNMEPKMCKENIFHPVALQSSEMVQLGLEISPKFQVLIF